MKITVFTKAKKYIKFDTESSNEYKSSSDIFQFIEGIWFDWFEDESIHNSEIEDMYFSEEACYDKKGAIRQGIEQLAEVAEEMNKTFFTEAELYTVVDIECAFN